MQPSEIAFRTPLLNAAGALGFTPDPRAPIQWDSLGAFTTNPISLRRRDAAQRPKLLEFAGGFLLHTGLPGPGFHAAVKKYGRRWADSALPIIVHLLADRPEETREMVRALEDMENVMAIELGFAPQLADDIILLACEMSRGELPIIVCLPPGDVLRLGPRTMQEGAAAVSLAQPRGLILSEGARVGGRLFGPALLPMTMEVVASASRAGIPTIAAGGIYSEEDANAMLMVGAIAVQLDSRFWLPDNTKRASSQ